MFSSRNKTKCQFSSKKILVGQVDLDHLHVRGQVIKFDNSTTLTVGVQNVNKMFVTKREQSTEQMKCNLTCKTIVMTPK